MLRIVIALAATLPLAQAADAATPQPPDLAAAVLAAPTPGRAPAPAVRLRLPDTQAEAYWRRSRGVAKTAVEASLDPDQEITGAVGFLCGLQPGARRTGAAAATGYDPSGRFLGAKLSMAFR